MGPAPFAISLAAVVGALVLAGCPSKPTPTPAPPVEDPTPPDPPVQAEPGADGARCLAAGDCASGVCEGEGCGDDQPGACAPARRGCTRDLRSYCGCNGVTFRGSGSCPGQRFASHGDCPDQ